MPYDLSGRLVIAISSRALFDLEEENFLYETEGLAAYTHHQIANEASILRPGTGFPLVKAFLKLGERIPVEVIIMSRNNAATSLRIFKSIEHYGLNIVRSAWTGGNSLVPYLAAFKVDLFLSANEPDVQQAITAETAAGKIYPMGTPIDPLTQQIRIAFDGDAVLFSDESERIYQQYGIEAFLAHERENANKLLPDGPFAKLLRAISLVQLDVPVEDAPIRTALVTARNSPAHERVIRTLNHWGVRIDEAFFLGGIEKQQVLRAFGPHIFFDDQDVHCIRAAQLVPTARVVYPAPELPSQIEYQPPPDHDEASLPTEEPPEILKTDSIHSNIEPESMSEATTATTQRELVVDSQAEPPTLRESQPTAKASGALPIL
jgi:5'-nucleotidase